VYRAAGGDGGDRVHYAPAKIESRLRAIRSGHYRLSRDARDAIVRFERAERGERDDLTRLKHLSWLPRAAEGLGRDFLVPTPDTRARFKRVFPDSEYARESRAGAWYCLRAFWRRRVFPGHDRVDDPLPVWLHLDFPRNGEAGLTAAEILSRDDVRAIAERMTHPRDRAWLWTSFSAARRPGEVYGLRVGDVAHREAAYYALSVRGEKTSDNRTVFVYEDAAAALSLWLAHHPRRDDPSAPLWAGDRGNAYGGAVSYKALEKALKVAARRAGIAKPVSPYRLRHAGLTALANSGLSDSALEAQAGWTPGSRRKNRYVRLSGHDLEGLMNKHHGIATESPAEKPRPAVTCVRCGVLNAPDAAFCARCGAAQTLAAVHVAEGQRQDLEWLTNLLREPGVLELLARRAAGHRVSPPS
jgi:integrase